MVVLKEKERQCKRGRKTNIFANMFIFGVMLASMAIGGEDDVVVC